MFGLVCFGIQGVCVNRLSRDDEGKNEEEKKKKRSFSHLAGLEPATFRLTAERANRLRHKCFAVWHHFKICHPHIQPCTCIYTYNNALHPHSYAHTVL